MRIDDIELIQAVQPQKPSISEIQIGGGVMEGGTVSSEYLMNDPDKISAGVSFLWEISDDGQTGWTKVGEEKGFSIA